MSIACFAHPTSSFQHFQHFGKLAARTLRAPPGSTLSSQIQLYTAFLLSAFIHGLGDLALGSPHSSATRESAPDIDPDFRSPEASPTLAARRVRRQPEQQDPMAILAADLEYTEKFLGQLRRLDAGDPAPAPTSPTSSAPTPTLEKLASDVIRRINDAARDHEDRLLE